MSEGAQRRVPGVEAPDDDAEPRSGVRPLAPASEAAFLREAGAIERAVRRALGLLPTNDPS